MATGPGHYGFGLREATLSYELLTKSREFAIHFLPAEKSEWIQAVGTFSGRDVDKFIEDAYFVYECRVVGQNRYGTHDWFVGEVIQAHQDKSVFNEDSLVDFNKIDIPLYIGRSEYRILDHNAPVKNHPLYKKKK
ncbi:flavin reductase family protein [Paenibacillus sp. QZ-Y1]|uniref:flavin reductase family protein n=1 Tax=Paenibacillus sp. QZ-Y1 TaxID=3414511 RepID=UPI003F793382